MIFFSSKKPYLKDIIPSGFVDIHSHLVPGIDDGAATVDESLNLITSLNSLGFEQFISTPHIFQGVWNNSIQTITDAKEAITIQLGLSSNNIPFRAAAEYLIDNHFSMLVQQQSLLCLKDNYVLVELSYINPPLQLMDFIFDCQVAGYQPILAHPERYLFYHSNFETYDKLKKAGCLFQLNLLSTVGYYGKEVLETADLLLKKGMIDFVGSDVHKQRHVDYFNKPLQIKNQIALQESMKNNSLFRF